MEFNTNTERIQRKLETLAVAIEATSEFISWMGPEPTIVQLQVFSNAWTRLYSIGNFKLLRSASEEFLAAGRIDSARNADVRYAIAEWYSDGDELESQYDLLRTAHANIGDYLSDSIPTLHLDSANAAMADHPTSRFPFDIADVLSDPRLESRPVVGRG